MKKCRIIQRTLDGFTVQYVIQQKHWLFFWKWTDASSNSWTSYCKDTFDTLEEAKDHIKYFDGTNPSYVVVYKNY
jgi:hypothetical protein